MTSRKRPSFAAALGAPLVLLACSSSGSTGQVAEAANDSPSDGATVDAYVGDAPSDASDGGVIGDVSLSSDAHEASTGDTGSDGSECTPISQACDDGGLSASGYPGYQCVKSWSTAEQRAIWCATSRPSQISISTDCDGFDIVSIGGGDTSIFYYYDTQSGDLVGIEFRGLGGAQCIAGEAPGVPLTDCIDAGSLTSFLCESDGAVSD